MWLHNETTRPANNDRIDHSFIGCSVKKEMRQALTYLLVSCFCLAITDVLVLPLAKRGCQDTCGNVTIPYPFGIGSLCYANSSFAVICENSTSPARLFLSSIHLEILNISLYGTVRVVQPVSPLKCSDELKTESMGKALDGSPFMISAVYNALTVLGCRNTVWLLADESTTIGGCTPICSENSTDTSCNGVNCCQITIPQGLKELQFTYRSIGFSNNSLFCGYAFLLTNNGSKKITGDIMASLAIFWIHLTKNLEMQVWYLRELDNLELSPHSWCIYRGINFSFVPEDLGSLTRVCECGHGFEGNPYLSEGCRDIDECSNSATNFCPNGITCINRIGYYECQEQKSRLKMVLIIIGCCLGALVLLLGAWRSTKAVRKRMKTNRKRKFFKRNGGLLLEQQFSSTDNGLEKTRLFTSKELAQATDHYNENRILGLGGQGTVYKGMLADGRIVAVKKSRRVDEDDLEVFINETKVPLLVYEFIPNGTLFQHIHESNEDFLLSWEVRVRIARDVAGALSYLHSAASAPIYHRDIKSTNILLDDKYRAKVSDFGTSRSVAIDQTHLTTRVLGTFGYLDPEYFQSSQFTEKSDVYSFGVVMVELITGKKAVSSVRAEPGKSLATHFLQSMEEDHLFDILDPSILKEGRREEVVAIAELARRCLHLDGKKRPTMKEVAVELEGIQLLKEGSVVVQNHDDIREFHSIEFAEPCSFSSISGSMHLDTITACSADDIEH
ncbi:Wall-associated receptor kinase-like 2 [Sesamum angolense]|uniref:Wall-associated receptor kinase-like 2 n=1 Tax=Sesamum angolense TaxID=2727404 RepID=A0AAE1XDC9_9LAMI|nr:Wall-associated receptor kinase-like 2 [Sesamum angolense]